MITSVGGFLNPVGQCQRTGGISYCLTPLGSVKIICAQQRCQSCSLIFGQWRKVREDAADVVIEFGRGVRAFQVFKAGLITGTTHRATLTRDLSAEVLKAILGHSDSPKVNLGSPRGSCSLRARYSPMPLGREV
jgi:hypothetical protein